MLGAVHERLTLVVVSPPLTASVVIESGMSDAVLDAVLLTVPVPYCVMADTL